MGRAYLQAGYAVEAMDEFDEAWARRGESFAMFLDDKPTYWSFSELSYWQAKARQGVGMNQDAIDGFEDFLKRRSREDDALVSDAKAQLEALLNSSGSTVSPENPQKLALTRSPTDRSGPRADLSSFVSR